METPSFEGNMFGISQRKTDIQWMCNEKRREKIWTMLYTDIAKERI